MPVGVVSLTRAATARQVDMCDPARPQDLLFSLELRVVIRCL